MSERSPSSGLAATGPVSFAIYALARIHRALAATLLRDLGLYTGQETMLVEIWQNDGVSLNDLAETMRLDHSTVTKSVKRLVDAGYVDRRRSDLDRRLAVITLTDEGMGLIPRIFEVWQELERRTTQHITKGRLAELVETAAAIEANLATESW
jgi:DNA-binding MarR family transcriptional regulator